MDDTLLVAGTRRFGSIADVEKEPGFSRGNAIHLASYRHLIGWYSFDKEELTCCVQKPSGLLCDRRHKSGWVASLKDDSVTIIGHNCAEDKFGADSTIFRDITRARNELDRLDDEARVRELLDQKESRVADLQQLIASLLSLQQRLGDRSRKFGDNVWNRLESMARGGSGRVQVQGYTPAVWDENAYSGPS